MHDKTLSKENANFKMYPYPKKMNYPQPSPETSRITLTRNTSHWEYLNPMRNLKLLEKYQKISRLPMKISQPRKFVKR